MAEELHGVILGSVICELDAEIDRACKENTTVIIGRETARHARAFLVELQEHNKKPKPLSELWRETDALRDKVREENAAREARGELVFRDDIERRFWGEAYAAWLPLVVRANLSLDAKAAADAAVRELRKRM